MGCVDLSLDGVPVRLLDTAGIREGQDAVEVIGIERATSAARAADVVLMVMDVKDGWTETDAVVFNRVWGDGRTLLPPSILVINKTDLAGDLHSHDRSCILMCALLDM